MNTHYPIPRLRAFVALVLAAVPALGFSQIQFYPIGDLPGGITYSEIRDATRTPAGIIAVGGGTQGPNSNFSDTVIRWTPSGGLQALPSLITTTNPGPFVSGSAISRDGTVIASRSRLSATNNSRGGALHLNNGNTLMMLPRAADSGYWNSAANALSSDGSIVYGFDYEATPPFLGFAWRWTASEGTTRVPSPANTIEAVPAGRGASADGSVMVATKNWGYPDKRGFIYTHGQGITELPLLPGGTVNDALAVSADGRIVMGNANSPEYPNGEIVLWKDGAVFQRLGMPGPDFVGSNFAGMSANAEVVVTPLWSPATGSDTGILNQHGWTLLSELLAAANVDMQGRTEPRIFGISQDATLLYGFATYNGGREAFLVEFPPLFFSSLLDETPPVFNSLTATPNTLWSPNNKMVDVQLTADVTDETTPNPVVQIVSVTSNEPDFGDWVITGPMSLQLRAKRLGKNSGRVYTITVSATDFAENVSTATVTVTVPHDQGKK
ncbi:MAG: hypothetical protein Q8M02_07255 [Candidatus Didemnitutus sp.]|nr:hypothetical protein [Candidatus Didemnitutus sp.]